MPTWLAARPAPSASSMSRAMRSARARSSASKRSTGRATERRTGSPHIRTSAIAAARRAATAGSEGSGGRAMVRATVASASAAGRAFDMTTRPIDEQLIKYLTDAHSIEEQALAQMRAAPDLAGDPQLADAFRAHLTETERHEQLVRARLDALGASPSKLKDLAGYGSGKAFVLFARSQPDTTGKLTTHALSYEHMEWAAYGPLMRVARRPGHADTEAVAARIRDEEPAMAQRLEDLLDRAVQAS